MTEESIDFSRFKYCECNCGELIPVINKLGKPARFKYTHHLKRGLNPSWKGGTRKHSAGYIRGLCHDHPKCDKTGYVYQHRLIYENYLFILFDEEMFIPKNWDIHHINGNKKDNSLINLELLHNKEHTRIHSIGNKFRHDYKIRNG